MGNCHQPERYIWTSAGIQRRTFPRLETGTQMPALPGGVLTQRLGACWTPRNPGG